MPVIKRLTIDTVNLDDESEMIALDQQAIQAGMTGVRAQAKGLIDENGKLRLTEVPEDMKEGSERDFDG
jgi:hypothetical protein